MKLGTLSYDKSVLGKPLSWHEVTPRIGEVLWYKREFQSHTAYQLVRLVRYLPDHKAYYIKGNKVVSDRIMVSTGADKDIPVDEYFNKDNFYELKRRERGMICKVKFFKDEINAYGGRDYTYKTELDLKPYEKVMAPVGNPPEDKKALVTEVNLPDSVIEPEWEYKVKYITKYDEGSNG